mgnify:CR=1 FL=1
MAYHVYLVDDDRFLLDLYAVKFKNAGHEVTVFSGGEEVLAALRKPNAAVPDAILLDLIMPGVSGFETIAKLRQIEATAKTPFMVLSNSAEEQSKKEEMEMAR